MTSPFTQIQSLRTLTLAGASPSVQRWKVGRDMYVSVSNGVISTFGGHFFYSIFLLSFNPSINIRNGFEILKSMLMWIPDQGESPILSLIPRREQNF